MSSSATGRVPPSPALRGTALVLLSAACFGSLSTLVKLALGSGATLNQLMALRFGIGAVLLFLVAGRAEVFREARARGTLVPLVLLGGVFQAGLTFLSLSSLRWLTPSGLAFLFFTYPVWIALLSAALGEERLTRVRVLALALAVAGVTLMVGKPWEGGMPLPGVLLALGSAVTYAVYVRLISRYQVGVRPASASALIAAGAAAAFLAVSAGDGSLLHPLTTAGWAAVLGMAVLCTLAGFLLFLSGIELLGPVRAAIVGTVEPFFTTLLAAAVLGDPMKPVALAGGALVIAGVVVQRVLEKEPQPKG